MRRRVRLVAFAAIYLVAGCGTPRAYEPLEDLARAEELAGLVAEGAVVGTMVVRHHLGKPFKAASGAVMVVPCTADVRSVLEPERIVKGEGPAEGDALAFGYYCRCQHNAADTFSQIFSLPARPGERVRVYLVKQGDQWRLIAHRLVQD